MLKIKSASQINFKKQCVSTSSWRLIAWYHRLSTHLACIILLALILVIVGVGIVYYKISYHSQMSALQHRLLGIVTTLSKTIDGTPIAGFNLDADQENEQQLTQRQHLKKLFSYVAGIDPDITTIYVLTSTQQPGILKFYFDFASNGEVGAVGEIYDATELPLLLQGFSSPSIETEPYQDVYGWSLSAYAPIKHSDGTVVGIVGADVELPQLDALRDRVIRLSLALVGVAIIATFILASLIAFMVRRPLDAVMKAVQRVSKEDWHTPLVLRRHDEFGHLAECFNQMLADLRDRQFLRETFGRYMSKKIAQALLQKEDSLDLGGKQCHVTILFSDLKNYTRISENLSPVLLVEMLNNYFGAMNEIIDAHNGCVIEFLGDAVLAVFGAPYDDANHAERAFEAALAMQRRLEQLNQQWEHSELSHLWQSSGVQQLEMRIGLHSGMVVAGNMGSQIRMKYAVIGDTVNVASRLESLNKELGTRILLSNDTKLLLKPESQRMLRCCGEHLVKGRDRSVTAFTVDESKLNNPEAQQDSDAVLVQPVPENV